MTRSISSAVIKGKYRRANDGKPAPGSALRALYDALRRGEYVHSESNLNSLVDYYGMEFESQLGIHGYVRLRGEWEGPFFRTLAEIMAEEARGEPVIMPERPAPKPQAPRSLEPLKGLRAVLVQLAQADVGDSVFISGRTPHEIGSTLSGLARSRHGIDLRGLFMTRKEGDGVRVWRT